MPRVDTVGGVLCLIEKGMLSESISNIKNGKTAGPSSVVSKMVKAAGKARADMIIDLVNQMIIGVIPAEWELSTIANCHKGK